jgi:predicted kinase
LLKAQNLVVDPDRLFLAIECTCPPDVARRRIARRLANSHDVSDARPEIHDLHRTRWQPWSPDIPQIQIDTEQPIGKQVELVIAALAKKHWFQSPSLTELVAPASRHDANHN